MSLILRNVKGTSLTYTEMDDNLTYLEGLSGATAGDLDGVLSLGNNSGTYSIEMGVGTYIYSSDTVQSLLMDYDDNGTPSIKLVNSSGYDITLGETIRLTGDGCELIVSDTVDITSGLYMGNGNQIGYINSRGVFPLNLGTLTSTGTVSVGNATYPVSIGGDLNIDDHATITPVDDVFGKGIIIQDGVTGINNIRLTDDNIFINANAAGITNGGITIYGTSGKSIEFNNSTFNDRIFIDANTQPFSAQGSTADLSSTTGTSNLSLNGNTASISGVLKSSNGTGLLELDWNGNADTIKMGVVTTNQSDWIHIDPLGNTPDFTTGMFTNDFRDDTTYLTIAPASCEILSEDTTGGIYAKIKTTKYTLADRSEISLRSQNTTDFSSLSLISGIGTAGSKITLTSDETIFNGVTIFSEYTVATLPTVIAGGWIMVTDETGGYTPAFSDGTNWRRTSDRAIVA